MNERLKGLRINAKMTQEDLAEKMNVSRQSIAKWESGESVPDVIKCSELAKIFNLNVEDIAAIFLDENERFPMKPKDKYIFGKCIITDHKITIPDEAMRVFGLKEGDELVLLGDVKQGIALLPIHQVNDFVQEFVNAPTFGGEQNHEDDH
ncbi:MAG: helix-turn-helix domain-containing protein [Acutalibacteraceae bacterium]|nr:helix-turn-helix domain-containing protein [Acutalibacteraceae bacterium]